MYGIMNCLADGLKKSSSTVTLATVKVLFRYISYENEIMEQVISKIRGPLITLLANTPKELSYVVLTHVNQLIDLGAGRFFEEDYKRFYCKVDDPAYIQQIKFIILVKICNEQNLVDILTELGEYSTDIDTFLSKKSIETLGKIGQRFPERNSFIIKQLASFIKIHKVHLMDEIAIAYANILRNSSNKIGEISENLESLSEQIQSQEAKVIFF